MTMLILLSLCFLTCGVFGDEVKSVSVMEGDSVTLHNDLVKQKDDRIVWYYGPENTFIARVNGQPNSIVLSDDERFKDRVMLDDQTGDLTITNIRPEHTGLYTLKISRNNKALYKKFTVITYAHLPVPDITSNSSQCSSSSSRCVVLCSVLNVRDVSLSWYKGNSLLSIISVSDLNISISLPLEVEYQDTNTYRCVLNNPITNQTQHLNITQLCQPCSDRTTTDYSVLRVIIISVVFALVLLCVIFIIICVYKHKQAFIENHKKPLYAKGTDEEKSLTYSSTSEDVNKQQL